MNEVDLIKSFDAMRTKMAADAEKAAKPAPVAEPDRRDLTPGVAALAASYKFPTAEWNAPIEGDHRFEDTLSPATAAYARGLKIPGAA